MENAVAGLDDDDDRRPIETSRVVIGAETDLTTDDALMSGAERTEFQSAVRFLREQLAGSEAYATDVQDAAEKDGHAAKTLRNARERAAYTRKGAGNRSIWGLRGMPKPDALGARHLPRSGTVDMDRLARAHDPRASRTSRASTASSAKSGEGKYSPPEGK